MPLLDVQHLSVSFRTREGVVSAVRDISFSLEAGETLGVVGESGSGKSVTCCSLLRLVPQPPGCIEGGRAIFDGVDLLACPAAQLRTIRGRRIAMIFQDPMTSLNPYLRIEDQVIEPLLIHERITRTEAIKRAVRMLEEVGVPDAARRMRGYPHQFSGGMRQRVLIAMALITRPDLLIADEPTTALDVTVQAQILDLIQRFQRERKMAVIWISHDLGVVAELCRRVLVMYAGSIVESASTLDLFQRPAHPYNRALQRSIPSLQAKGTELHTIPGVPPDLSKPIVGCAFAPRCDFRDGSCESGRMTLQSVSPGRATACRRVQQGEISP